MVELPIKGNTDLSPGRVADWVVEISPSDPLVTARLATSEPFVSKTIDPVGAVGALVGALVGDGKPPPLIVFSRADTYAQLDVDAEIGLGRGSFGMQLHHALERDWTRLTAAKEACAKAAWCFLVATVKLGWNRASGPLAIGVPSGQNLVEAGRYVLTEIQPGVEGVSWKLTLRGEEMFGYRLSRQHVRDGSAATPEQAAAKVLEQCRFTPDQYALRLPATPPAPDAPPVTLDLGSEALGEMRRLGSMMETTAGKRGRSPYLVRDGVLVIGMGRAIPYSGSVLRVSAAEGLQGYAQTGEETRRPGFSFKEAMKDLPLSAPAPTEPMRRRFRLDLVGAPAVKPGDVVRFPVAGDAGLAAALAAQAVPGAMAAGGEDWSHALSIYVASVSHRLDRNKGFTTTVSGLEVETVGDADVAIWDVPVAAPSRAAPGVAALSDDGTPEGALAGSVAQFVGRAMRQYSQTDVGEVVASEPGTSTGNGRRLSSRVVRGATAEPGGALRSVTHDIWRVGATPLPSVPYVTPFAWGPYGLVLPRYPGTRVVMTHGGGDPSDPLDIGALWNGRPDAASAGPPQAKFGDWWLSLPAGVEPASADAALASPAQPAADSKATNDLTAADGGRVLEVGQLVIRVGEAALAPAGRRPDPGDAPRAGILIEQKDGSARITIDQDGKVTIKAANVVVEVEGTMDVKGA